MDYGHILLRDGVVIVPVFSAEETSQYNNAFWWAATSFPEYLNPQNTDTIFVQGAFGALGNPSSFHNPIVRHIRLNMMFRAVSLFRTISDGKNLEQLFDRMAIRRKGTTLGKETWHRDQAPCSPDDQIFGGWINLDTTGEQRFSCIPGSHIIKRDNTGFVKEAPVNEKQKIIYQIPPGHWIIFYQNILHEVLPGKVKYDSIRLFLGWRLTNSDTSLFNHSSILEEQGVPYNPSGQLPTMYAPNHITFHSNTLIWWSNNTFKPQCLEQRNSEKLGTYIVVHKIMSSLHNYNFPLYSEYTEEERSILQPRRKWIIDNNELNL
jgi:hypothetical protein